MAYQFLDKSGLNIILNKIKNVFVPKERKIAELDLKDDITAEELATELNEYIGGKDGKSAYEVAVDEGFVGSERRWLESLKGEQGKSGVYIGSGEMPDGYSVQIDPDGELMPIDQQFNAESINAQSGIAVAEAISDKLTIKNFTLEKPEKWNEDTEDILSTLIDKNYTGIVYNAREHATNLSNYYYESRMGENNQIITQYRTFLEYKIHEDDSALDMWEEPVSQDKETRQGVLQEDGSYSWTEWRDCVNRSIVRIPGDMTYNLWENLQNYNAYKFGHLYSFPRRGSWYIGMLWYDDYTPYKKHLGCINLSNGLYHKFDINDKKEIIYNDIDNKIFNDISIKDQSTGETRHLIVKDGVIKLKDIPV